MNNKNNNNKNNNKKTFDISKLKQVQENETIICSYNGGSVRKCWDAIREMKIEFPKIYMFTATLPVRAKDDGRVIVEGKYELGCYWKGKPMTLSRFLAQVGYKLPTKGTKQRCLELLTDYKNALNHTGKYALKSEKKSGK